MKYALVILSTLLFCGAGVSAQDERWTTQTIGDAGFSVSVPGKFESVPEFNGEHGLVMEPERQHPYETYYAIIEHPAIEARFGVVVVQGPLRAALIKSGTMASYYDYLGRIFFGDPRADFYFRVGEPITRHNLTGVDHLYIREDLIEPPRFTHGRIFDNGSKSYVVIYRAQTKWGLQKEEALKFLNSFRVTSTSRAPRRRRAARK